MKVLLKILGIVISSIAIIYVLVRTGYYEIYLKHILDIMLFTLISLIIVSIHYDNFIFKILSNLDKLSKNKAFAKYEKEIRLDLTLFSITSISSCIMHYRGVTYLDATLFTMSLMFLALNILDIAKIYKLTGGNLNEN